MKKHRMNRLRLGCVGVTLSLALAAGAQEPVSPIQNSSTQASEPKPSIAKSSRRLRVKARSESRAPSVAPIESEKLIRLLRREKL